MTRLFLSTLLAVVAASLSSCLVQINGLTNGHSSLTEANRKKLEHIGNLSPIDAKLKPGTIYLISAEQLKTLLPTEGTNLVYYYSPNCHQESCVSLQLFLDYCKRKGYRPYVVAQYFDNGLIAEWETMAGELRLFGMDHRHYKSRYVYKVEKQFFESPTGLNDETTAGARYFKFDGQRFDTFQRELAP